MEKIQIAHEAPVSIMEIIDRHTDYTYCLVHLLEENPEYLAHFEKILEAGRVVILDNSIFELGESFEMERYYYWIRRLKPTYYIIPDVLEDAEGTRSKFNVWKEEYLEGAARVSSPIAVVQGKDYNEIATLYKDYILSGVYYIAISFDYSMYTRRFPHPNKLVSYALGRVELISRLYADSVIQDADKVHLLGASLPIEFHYYKDRSEFPFIYSLDTSNPVVAGVLGEPYEPFTKTDKSSTKLFTLINAETDEFRIQDVLNNIESFRKIVNPDLNAK